MASWIATEFARLMGACLSGACAVTRAKLRRRFPRLLCVTFNNKAPLAACLAKQIRWFCICRD